MRIEAYGESFKMTLGAKGGASFECKDGFIKSFNRDDLALIDWERPGQGVNFFTFRAKGNVHTVSVENRELPHFRGLLEMWGVWEKVVV